MGQAVVCQGLCSKRFPDKDAAIASGKLFPTGVCVECYESYARNPQTCFGKKTRSTGKRLANPDDPVCQQCPEFAVCSVWKNPVIESEVKQSTKGESKMAKKAAAPAEETLDFQPLDETETVEAQPEAAQPAATTKRKKAAAAPAPAPKKRKAAAAPAPAPKKKAAPAETPVSPYQDGSARDIMFKLLRGGFRTKDEVVAAAKNACKDPAAVFAGNFHPHRNTRDNNEKYFKWSVTEKGGKFKVIVA